MNLKGLFQEFNPSKFLIYSSAFLFTILLGLRLDKIVDWSFLVIFAPLWIWKITVFAGAITGTLVWIKHPEYRREENSELHAMLICAFFHLLLFVFELLLCSNLSGFSLVPFRAVFSPLFVMSALSIAACIWGFRHDRSLELETFFSVNVLQFICLALKLDNVISWKWVIVFVPLWIVLTLLCVVVIYYVIWALLFLRSPEVTPRQRRGHVIYATLSCFMIFPLLSFIIALSRKLDSVNTDSFAAVFIPLQLSLASLIISSFYQKGGNHWWFGIRKDFCEYLLDICPCLREYGNVSYKFADTLAPVRDDSDPQSVERKPLKLEQHTANSSDHCLEVPD
ncbi:transmembrane protein 185-like [Rhopilema esculentum]|uniref:transmembrane protein 185-like n=1 Tax=Rhopilema esculentum TaxID=499914 RepID=UPI0031D92DC2